MTTISNKENENILFFQPNDEVQDQNNLDEYIDKQIKQAKNHSKALKQQQVNKGLNILDQNNNCIKINPNKPPQNNTTNNPLIQINVDNNNQDVKMDISSQSDSIDLDLNKKNKENVMVLSPPNFLSNDAMSESEHNHISEKIGGLEQTSVIPLNIDINTMFRKRESDNLLLKCGESSYKFNKVLEESMFRIPPNFLDKHKINPYIRTKMVDWMIEVLSVFDSSEETFFLSVNIMDLFLWKTQTIYKNENVHLIGVGCMFIASKFQEIYPISLKMFEHRIGHDQFKASDIKKMEAKIFKDIKPENLVSTSVYDFSKTYFYDFYYNNKNLIASDEEVNIYKYIKVTSLYLNKMILHYEFFYQEKCSIKAIGCIVTAVKIVGDYLGEKFPMNVKGIYNDWMLFLIEQGGFDKQKVESISNRIYTTYQHYQKSKSISRNLNRFTPLPYIKK